MKLAFFSDVHGNAAALEAVIEDIQKKQVDKIFVLGDLAYRGPEPKKCIQMIQELRAEVVIKGNADEWIVRGVKKGEVPDQVLELMNTERNWAVEQLNDLEKDYLKQLPPEYQMSIEGINFHLFHATPTSLFEVIPPHAEDEMIQEKIIDKNPDATVYLYGHIHKAYIRFTGGKTIINLGSVGLPFDGHNKASYALVDITDGQMNTSIQKVSYNIEQTIKAYRQNQYPNADMMIQVLQKANI